MKNNKPNFRIKTVCIRTHCSHFLSTTPNKHSMQLFKPPTNASLQRYLFMLRHLRRILFSMGVDVLDPAHRPGWRVAIIYASIFSFILCMAYNVYSNRHHPDEVLQCICLIGVPVRGFISTSTLLWHRRHLERIHQLSVQLHRNASSRYRPVLVLWMRRAELVFQMHATIYVCTGVLIMLFPVIYYALYGELALMLAIKVPGIDEKSLGGWAAVSVYEVLCVFYSVGIILGFDTLFLVLNMMASAYLHLVRIKCEQLSEQLIGRAKPEQERDSEVQPRCRKRIPLAGRLLVDVIFTSQRANAFIESVCQCFESTCGMLVGGAGMTLALCVLAGRVTKWPMAFPLGMSLLYSMLSYSLIGSALDQQNENVLMTMYAVPWDRLEVRERRLFVLIVLRWQRPRCITVFGSVKLNVATALRVGGREPCVWNDRSDVINTFAIADIEGDLLGLHDVGQHPLNDEFDEKPPKPYLDCWCATTGNSSCFLKIYHSHRIENKLIFCYGRKREE